MNTHTNTNGGDCILYCPNCGTKVLDNNSNFCCHCGWKISSDSKWMELSDSIVNADTDKQYVKPIKVVEPVEPLIDNKNKAKSKKMSDTTLKFLIIFGALLFSLLFYAGFYLVLSKDTSEFSHIPKATGEPSTAATYTFNQIAVIVGETALNQFSEFDPSYSIDEQRQEIIITTNVAAKRSDFDAELYINLSNWDNTIETMLEYNKELIKLFSEYGYNDVSVVQDFGCYDDGSLIVVMNGSVIFDYAKYKGFK